MLLTIVAIASCALIYAWPSIVIARASDDEVMAALPAPPAPRAAEPAQPKADPTPLDALNAVVSAASKFVVSVVQPPQADPREELFNDLVRRARRSQLWAVPLVAMVIADALLVVESSGAGMAYQAATITVIALLDTLLICAALMMFAMSRGKVTPQQRDRFQDAWAQKLGERAQRIRERTEIRRMPRPSASDPIITGETEGALASARTKLLGTGNPADQLLAEQVLHIAAQMRELEASPHRDGHADASAQIYAEQVVDVLDTYFDLTDPSDHDVAQVRSVLSIADSALDKEAERLDGKARLSLDATKAATEALYRQRFGSEPEVGDTGADGSAPRP